MTREEWERRLYEKLAGWVLDATVEARSGSLLARWLAGCTEDLKKTITAAWALAQPPLPTETTNGKEPTGKPAVGTAEQLRKAEDSPRRPHTAPRSP